MVFNAARYLAEVVFGLFSLALLLRFYLQLARAPYRNPLSHFLNALTDFAVKPARRIVPGLWGVDLATLVLAWVCETLLLLVQLILYGMEHGVDAGAMGAAVHLTIVVLAFVKLLKTSVYLAMVAVIVQALLSWFNPYSPVAPLLNSLTGPLLRPLRKRIPPVGGVDLTPLAAIVILQLLLILPIAWLETIARIPG